MHHVLHILPAEMDVALFLVFSSLGRNLTRRVRVYEGQWLSRGIFCL